MKPIKKRYIFCALALAALFAGCQDDVIDAAGGDNEILPGDGDASEVFYMAVRIYNAASIDAGTGTRADGDESFNFDSQGGNYENHDKESDEEPDKTFNIGNLDENKIFSGKDSEVGYVNYLLVFGKDNQDKLEYILDLVDWDLENGTITDANDSTTTSGYTSYKTFYTSAQRQDIPAGIFDRKVLAVLNSSKALKKALRSGLGTTTYDRVLTTMVKDLEETPVEENATSQSISATKLNKHLDYLFYIDEYLNVEKYFTMSSSIVYPLDKGTTAEGSSFVTEPYTVGPAILKRSFKWQTTKQAAAKAPIFSFFLERLQSKFTVTFQKKGVGNKIYFGKENKVMGKDYESRKHIVFNPTDFDFETSTINVVSDYKPEIVRPDTDLTRTRYEITPSEDWKINILGWSINAVHPREYVFKKLTTLTPPDYYEGWNVRSYSNYRNFWAESDNYNGRNFPDQFRRVKQIKKYKNYEDPESLEECDDDDPEGIWMIEKLTSGVVSNEDDFESTLNYLKPNDLSKRLTSQYAPENTYDPNNIFTSISDAYAAQAHLRAGSHVIIAAQLLIKEIDPVGVYPATSSNGEYADEYFTEGGDVKSSDGKLASDKLLMNDLYWSPKAYREFVREYLGYWMQYHEDIFGPNDGILYQVKTDSNGNRIESSEEDIDMGSLLRKGSDNWVYVIPNVDEIYENTQKNKLPNTHKYYQRETSDNELDNVIVFYSYNPKTYTFNPISHYMFEVLSLLHPEYFAQRFNKGLMYYAIPIEHFKSEQTEVGHYGNVRNHWYNFNITNIKGMGTPVDRIDQVIIPNNERSYESLGVTLSILPWHTVQEPVDISNQRPQPKPDQIDLDLHIKADDWIYEGTDYTEEGGF